MMNSLEPCSFAYSIARCIVKNGSGESNARYLQPWILCTRETLGGDSANKHLINMPVVVTCIRLEWFTRAIATNSVDGTHCVPVPAVLERMDVYVNGWPSNNDGC